MEKITFTRSRHFHLAKSDYNFPMNIEMNYLRDGIQLSEDVEFAPISNLETDYLSESKALEILDKYGFKEIPTPKSSTDKIAELQDLVNQLKKSFHLKDYVKQHNLKAIDSSLASIDNMLNSGILN